MKNRCDCSCEEKAKSGGGVCRNSYELQFKEGTVKRKCPEGTERPGLEVKTGICEEPVENYLPGW